MPACFSFLTCLFLLLFFCAPGEAATIEGVVVTEQGPLEGAVVKAYPSLQDALSDNSALSSTTGNTSGYYRLELPVGTYCLTASGSEKEKKYISFHGANPVTVEDKAIWLPFAVSPLTTPVHNVVETPGIVGTVLYKGKPVSEAQVSLYSFSENNVRGLGLQTKYTDTNGKFSLTAPPAAYVLIARKRKEGTGKRPLVKGDLFCFYGANPVDIEEGRQTVVDVHCHPKDDLQAFLASDTKVTRPLPGFARYKERMPGKTERGISGRVVNRYGTPVKDIQVTAYLRDPSKTFQMHHIRLASENMVHTAGDGRYFLPVNKTGSYYLVARQFSGESPLKGELYGLYEANADHAVTVSQGVATADITVGMVMDEASREEPPLGDLGGKVAPVHASAVIERDTIWSGEVVVEGAVLVARAATLSIAPGTNIRFKRVDRDEDGVGDGELRVLGRIIARGTPEKPIRFLSAEHAPRPGDWSYLLLFTSGEENVIEHTTFEHAFTGLQVHFSRAAVRDSVFRNNREGIRFGRAELDIEHNEIRNNDVGIRYHRLEGPVVVHDNLITGNGVGLFLVPSTQKFVGSSAETYTPDPRYYMSPIITDNTIADNLTYNFQLGERLSTDVSIGGNWWGSKDTARIRTTVFDRERDPELGKITIFPVRSAPVQGAGPRKGGK